MKLISKIVLLIQTFILKNNNIAFYANLEQCDIKKSIKSHFVRKFEIMRIPRPPKKSTTYLLLIEKLS
jgi:hypothetical protein